MAQRRGIFRQISIPAPQGLMNTAISPQALSTKFARYIENLVPSAGKAGTLAKRYGFSTLGDALSSITFERLMWHVKSDGTVQILAYTSDGKIKLLNEGTGAWSDQKTGLNTSGVVRFCHFNEKLIIVNGHDTPMYWDGSAITDISEYVEDANAITETWIAANQFSLDTGTRGDGDYPTNRNIRLTITATGLSVSGITRSGSTATATTAANHNLPNGTTVTIAGANETEYNGTYTISNVTANTFDYTVSGTPATPATGTITYSFTSQTVTDSVSSTALSGTVLTVTSSADFLPAVSVTIEKVEYEDSPPAFSYIYPQHDRLWALAPKELKADDWDATEGDRMKVYYTDVSNSETAWFNATTQEVGFINVQNKHGTNDQLEAISAIDGNMVFFGRNKTQVWAGVDPTTGGDFSWVKTLPVGCIHGDLVQEFPRDILFVTRYGARSIRTVFQTEGIEASTDLGTNIDPTIQADVDTLVSSDANYKLARSFGYDRDGFFGFKIGAKTLIYALTEESKGWVVFGGLFENMEDAVALPDGRLILAKDAQLYTYTNGADGNAKAYVDNASEYRTIWHTPWITPGGRWANRHWSLMLEPGSPSQTLLFRRFKDNNGAKVKDFALTSSTAQSTWGEADWGEDPWGARVIEVEKRDKFIAFSFAVRVESFSTTGPLEIVGLIALGS